MIKPIIIAIDGHASTGKSAFAKQIALQLGFLYLDSGALYRAVSYLALEYNLIDNENNIDIATLKKILTNSKLTLRKNEANGKSEPYINGICVENEIRGLNISNIVSHIAKLQFVRDYVDKILRLLGINKAIVMDGRDIGTIVFPNAEIKLFMTASPEIRAKRRLIELVAKNENVDYESVLKNIRERDFIDQNRENAPLTQAKDSILLDNSNLTIEDQMNWFLNFIKVNGYYN